MMRPDCCRQKEDILADATQAARERESGTVARLTRREEADLFAGHAAALLVPAGRIVSAVIKAASGDIGSVMVRRQFVCERQARTMDEDAIINSYAVGGGSGQGAEADLMCPPPAPR